MKKNYIFKTILFSIPLFAFILMASSGGRDDGRTGSPGDSGNTCAACHTTAPTTQSVSISTDIPAGGYALNTNYSVTVDVTSSSPDHGFQLTAENASNTKVGSYTAGTGSRLATGNRITHSNDSQSSWTFTWTSPASDEGNITFYAAAVAADGNGGNGAGDVTVSTSSSPVSVLSIADAKRLDFDVYPNPSNNIVNVQLPSGVDNSLVSIFDYTGRQVKNQKVNSSNKEINIQDLASGIYILRVEAGDKIGTQQFIKE